MSLAHGQPHRFPADALTQRKGTAMRALGSSLPTPYSTSFLKFDLPAQIPPTRRWALPNVRCAAHTGNDRRSTVHSTHDYYELLGVSVDASYDDIRKAYRKMQKKHHPDIAGPEGHAMTLLLNQAYQTLTSDTLRNAYGFRRSKANASYAPAQESFTGVPFSKWSGPDRPQGIFVDENSCIGCRECVFRAGKTFFMDESCGSARVTTQWGDSDSQIKVALEACPVNCIHYVEKDDLPFLEYLMRPHPKASNGVYGGGWERPANIFMAARTFKRKFQADSMPDCSAKWRDETPAQRKARMDADFKVRAGAFWWLWSWGAQYSGPTTNGKQSNQASNWPSKGLFGRSSTSELLNIAIDPSEISKVVEVVQEWALTFSSSSELPLPLPFRSDNLPNGVQLTLITTNNGVLGTMGTLLLTVEEQEEGCFLTMKRQGVTGTGALPGERTIIRHVKEALRGDAGSYNMYHIPRH